MPLKLTTIEEMHDYLSGVMDRAIHHAPGISEVVMPLFSAVVWKMNPHTFKAKVYMGEAKNAVWVEINGKDYFFRYEHADDTIETRQKNHHGRLIHKYDNNSDIQSIIDDFEAL